MISKKELQSIGKNSKKVIAVYDLETTDANPAVTNTVQFAAAKVYPNGEYKTLDFLLNPEQPIAKGAEEVHGISNEKVKDCPKFKDVAGQISDFFKDVEIVSGYNIIRFDNVIITRQMESAGFKDFLAGKVIQDIYLIYMQEHRRKLGDCCSYYLGEEIKDAHTALGDVETCFRCLGKIQEKHSKPIDEIKSEVKVSGIEKHLTISDKGDITLNFGKNKGKNLKEVDPSYLSWILQGEFSKDVKEVIKGYQNANKQRSVK